MRQTCFSIILVSLVFCTHAAVAQGAVPSPAGARFPIIQASLDDGFFSLAEQQARGLLREDPSDEDANEALLLLSHALWGQKRYSEMLDLLDGRGTGPGLVYWRARAHYEIRQYEQALEVLDSVGEEKDTSRFAPYLLRLHGHIEQRAGELIAAEASFARFAENYPDHPERIENEFDLAEMYTLQKRIPEAIASYESLVREEDNITVQRAQLKLANVLYTQGAAENFDRARNLLDSLGVNESNRLSYRIDAYVD
ncbi:MAG: tetratricopeptide repeat protein, partial [Pontiella sp.]|nr:tetratricopeptide repeat protein [Pontiella sp.]